MNSNEQIHNTAGHGADAETDKLPDLLKDALADVCPDPGGRIAASVMAQIRAQREAAEKERRTARAEARRRRQGLFMKWGGMAACMMILCGALVIAAPLMNRSADMTTEDAAAQQECLTADSPAEAYAYAAGNGSADEPAEDTFTYTAEDVVTEEAAVTKSAPVKKMAAAEETEPETAQDGGSSVVQYSVRMSLTASMDAAAEEVYDPAAENEAFLQYLLDEGGLTQEQYAAWMAGMGYTEVWEWTIDELCEAFGIENRQ